MPNFRYRAITEKGAVVEGVICAESREAVLDDLSRKGLLPSDIRRTVFSFSSVRVAEDEFLFFIGEFSALIRSGIPIPEALGVITDQRGRSPLLAVVNQVRMDVLKGARLSEALVRHPSIFEALFLALIRVGERSGDLASSLRQYQKLLERKSALKRKVIQALVYPAFVLALTVAIVGVLFFFSLPRFTELYADLGADMPGPTLVMLAIARWMTDYGWLVPLATIGVVVIVRQWVPTERIRLAFETVLRHLPAIGKLNEYYSLSLCCHALESLLISGMTMVDSIRYVASIVPTIRLATALRKTSDRIQHGSGLVSALRAQDIFSPSALKLIDAGEKSGTVLTQFQELAHYYDRLFEHRMSSLVAMFEPMLILVTGVIVGVAVVAMYLPIFGMAGAM